MEQRTKSGLKSWRQSLRHEALPENARSLLETLKASEADGIGTLGGKVKAGSGLHVHFSRQSE